MFSAWPVGFAWLLPVWLPAAPVGRSGEVVLLEPRFPLFELSEPRFLLFELLPELCFPPFELPEPEPSLFPFPGPPEPLRVSACWEDGESRRTTPAGADVPVSAPELSKGYSRSPMVTLPVAMAPSGLR